MRHRSAGAWAPVFVLAFATSSLSAQSWPSTGLWSAALTAGESAGSPGGLSIGAPSSLAAAPGYDNQPAFLADGASLGSPSYPSLSPAAPASLRRGGEDGAEMGVHHHLRRPPRLDAARRLVEPYVPAGMQIGLFGS